MSAVRDNNTNRVYLANDKTLVCTGSWTVHAVAGLQRQLDHIDLPGGHAVVINGEAITSIDTAGAWLINRIRQQCETGDRQVRFEAFTPEHTSLLERVGDVIHATPAKPATPRLHTRWLSICSDLVHFLAFIGETIISLLRALANPRRVRWKVILAEIADAGYKAMPIVGLLSFLMGVVIAYQGAVQLKLYGANIYVADLVGFSMLRELAPLLTAIVISGRTGSAYAAQIGTMQVTEEVAAMRTIGISPMDMLVLPKLLALIIVMPLLSVFADIMSITGGMLMANL